MWRLLWLSLASLLVALRLAGAPLVILSPATAPYVGPCDLVSCAEAYSPGRAMTSAYSGNLFQLIRTSDNATLTIGQASGHIADLRGVAAFCAKTTCVFGRIYGQINGNDLLAANGVGQVGNPPSLATTCVTTTACAPLYFVDAASGSPIVRTLFPTQMYSGNGAATGITGGTHASSVYSYGRNEGWSNCCGTWGIAHPANTCCVAGQDFLAMQVYGVAVEGGACSGANAICAGVDEESPAALVDFADYTPIAVQAIAHLITWDGSAATNTIKSYLNSSTAAFSHSPPQETLGPGTTIRIGGGGDLTHTDTIWQEGLIANAALSSANYAAIQANTTAFYAAHAADACSSTADFGYYFNGGNGNYDHDTSLASTILGYSLRRMSASYFGPIADLRDALGTVNTYGPASSGCGIDTAAATFCAANPPCSVAKLYNQGTYSSQNVGNAHDTALDLVQATTADQPTVNFAGLNGLPTLVFSGSQFLCSGTPGSNDAFAETIGIVGKRSGGFTSNSPGFMFHGDGNWLGWSNATNTVKSTFPSANITGSLSDSAFHSMVYELLTNGAAGTTLYGDNASLNTATNAFSDVGTHPICLGTDGTHANFLTGEIAEATATNDGVPGAVGTATIAATVYTKQHAVWGI